MGLCSRTLALPKLFPPHALQFGWEMSMSTFIMESGLVNSTKRQCFLLVVEPVLRLGCCAEGLTDMISTHGRVTILFYNNVIPLVRVQ